MSGGHRINRCERCIFPRHQIPTTALTTQSPDFSGGHGDGGSGSRSARPRAAKAFGHSYTGTSERGSARPREHASPSPPPFRRSLTQGPAGKNGARTRFPASHAGFLTSKFEGNGGERFGTSPLPGKGGERVRWERSPYRGPCPVPHRPLALRQRGNGLEKSSIMRERESAYMPQLSDVQ
jgi:hypothetical protein